jgi:hypothetical protein
MPGGPNSGKRADVATRRNKAINLKMAGATWQMIADQCGYASEAAALMDIKRFRQQQNLQAVASYEELRDQEGERLDRLQMGHWAAAVGGDKDAAAVVLKIMERRAKLMGLDAPRDFNVLLEGRLDVEAATVVEAILAAADKSGLPAADRMRMLEAAQQHLAETAKGSDVIQGEVVASDE